MSFQNPFLTVQYLQAIAFAQHHQSFVRLHSQFSTYIHYWLRSSHTPHQQISLETKKKIKKERAHNFSHIVIRCKLSSDFPKVHQLFNLSKIRKRCRLGKRRCLFSTCQTILKGKVYCTMAYEQRRGRTVPRPIQLVSVKSCLIANEILLGVVTIVINDMVSASIYITISPLIFTQWQMHFALETLVRRR